MNWLETQRLILAHTDLLLTGKVLSVDPASGAKSMPGWALFEAGELTASGVIQVTPGLPIHQRLVEIGAAFRQLAREEKPDVLLMEQIHSMPGFVGKSVDILMKGVGAIIASVPAKFMIEISPRTWKRSVDADYVKSDESDAIYLGKFLLSKTQELAQKELKPRKAPSTRKANLTGEKRRSDGSKTKHIRIQAKSSSTKRRTKRNTSRTRRVMG